MFDTLQKESSQVPVPPLSMSLIIPRKKKKSKIPLVFSSLAIVAGVLLVVLPLVIGNLNTTTKEAAAPVSEDRQAELAKVLGTETQSSATVFNFVVNT